MRYINELREGQSVIEHYLCKSRQSLKSRAGKTYLSLKLQDKDLDFCINTILEEIFYHNDTVSKHLKTHSAAKSIHHSYMGGLLEHTLSVTEICDFVAPRYQFVNRDILIASAMLHDIGKIIELSEFPENDYTDEGQLLGHLMIGSELIKETASHIEGFPKQIENLLKHCMISHHGEYEYGSPKLPKTIEAFILHSADNLDAKTKVIEEMIQNNTNQGSWVGYQKMLQRNIRKSDF